MISEYVVSWKMIIILTYNFFLSNVGAILSIKIIIISITIIIIIIICTTAIVIIS